MKYAITLNKPGLAVMVLLLANSACTKEETLLPYADFTIETNPIYPARHDFLNKSKNASYSEWFINGISVSNKDDLTSYYFKSNVEYTIMLLTKNKAGQSSSLEKVIKLGNREFMSFSVGSKTVSFNNISFSSFSSIIITGSSSNSEMLTLRFPSNLTTGQNFNNPYNLLNPVNVFSDSSQSIISYASTYAGCTPTMAEVTISERQGEYISGIFNGRVYSIWSGNCEYIELTNGTFLVEY